MKNDHRITLPPDLYSGLNRMVEFGLYKTVDDAVESAVMALILQSQLQRAKTGGVLDEKLKKTLERLEKPLSDVELNRRKRKALHLLRHQQ